MNNSLNRNKLQQPDQSKSGIDLEKNNIIREILLDVITENGAGIPFKELSKPVEVNLSQMELADLGSVNKYTMSEKWTLKQDIL
jgi:hypothetical protein